MSNLSNYSDIIRQSRHCSVDTLLNSFHSAAEHSNLNQFFGCFDYQGRFLGSDGSENWDVNEFVDYVRPHFASGNGWTYKPIPKSRKIVYYPPNCESVDIKFCTFDELIMNECFGITTLLRLGECRGSGTLIYDKELNSWFIAAYHLSFPIPNPIAHNITQQIKEYDMNKRRHQADELASQLLAELDLEDKKNELKQKEVAKKKKKKK